MLLEIIKYINMGAKIFISSSNPSPIFILMYNNKNLQLDDHYIHLPNEQTSRNSRIAITKDLKLRKKKKEKKPNNATHTHASKKKQGKFNSYSVPFHNRSKTTL